MAAQVVVPLFVADAIREHLGVGLPAAVPVPVLGETFDDRSRLLHQAWDEAYRRGFANRDGIDPFIQDAFELLATPEVAVEVVVGDPKARRDDTAIVAMRGAGAVFATITGQGLLLRGIDPAAAARTLVDPLPDVPPGAGQAVSVPLDLLQTRRAAANLETALRDGGMRAGDVRQFALAVQAPRIRGGKFSALYAERYGTKQHRLPTYVDFFDNERGRYMTQVNSSGPQWHLILVPANKAKLAERVHELIVAARESS